MSNMRYFLTTILLLVGLHLLAQQAQSDSRQYFTQAESEYSIGRTEQAVALIEGRVASFDGTLKISSYRLLALCFLAQDDRVTAEKYVDLLLKEDPYYSITLNDPEKLAEMIRNKKQGKATLVTASQQAETIEEAPVPVTLITQPMIEAVAAKTLKDVLVAYVPGMNDVASANEVNVAMRGVYTVGQQKILIMLNGHRLNSRSYNGANPDFGISLDKVKQIEVLRGPASSLYGNVALTAVVNIICKDGYDIDGIAVKGGLGSYGERHGEVTIGKRFMYMDFMAWGSIYSSDGEKFFVPASRDLGAHPRDGYAILGGYRDKPAYDYGFVFKLKNLSLMFNQRYCKMIEPFNSLDNMLVNPGAVHDYGKYRLWDHKEGPGAGFGFTHSELKYGNSTGNFAFDAAAYYDNNRNNLYTALGDIANIPEEALLHNGPWQILLWSEYALGVTSKGSIKYGKEQRNSGNFMFGGQVEYMNLYNQLMCNGYKFTEIASIADFITTGDEMSYSLFAQEKHYFSRSWVVNAGLRFDYKSRMNNKSVNALSPRVSLIYMDGGGKWNGKLSYARSFVDAPYFYRYNFGIESFTGNESLSPENLDSWQLTAGYKPTNTLYLEANLFYNKLTNFIYNDKTADIANRESPFKNAGRLESIGAEAILTYTSAPFTASWNMTWQRVLDGKNYSFRGSRVYNIPPVTSNLVLNYAVVRNRKIGTVSLRANFAYTSDQLSPIAGATQDITIGGIATNLPDNTVKARAICNCGVQYTLKRLCIDGQCYNIFDTRYYQGGTTIVPYIQPGRWFSLNLSYKF